ncbi:bestrophin-like domain [Actinokineospora sp.]|uniref:bestrophin-like domain n=1 Tax=Actinokineospora sp. TaxID=1872133 RepID=UPI00403821E7
MNIYVTGLLWVVGAAVVAAAVAYLIRRIGETEGTVSNNEAAGQVFTIVGGLHAVLLAFVLISLFDAVSAAEDGSYREADGLVAASWAAESLPEPARTEVRDLSASYASTVADDEWPLMREGSGDVADQGWAELDQLRAAVSRAQATDEWQNSQKTEAAEKLLEVYQARQERLNTAGSDGVSTVVWFALIAGSVMSISLPLLFGGPRPVTHIIIVSILAGTLSLLLFATSQLQNPYAGGAMVGPDAFESVLARLR